MKLQTGIKYSDKTSFFQLKRFSKACKKFSVGFTNMFKVFERCTQPRSLRQWKNRDLTTHQSDYMAGKVTKVEILKNETPKWDRIFWHSRQFLVMELNFLGLETRKYMFYHQINGTTFFLAYFLTLEYILGIFLAQLTKIFRKNARGPLYSVLAKSIYLRSAEKGGRGWVPSGPSRSVNFWSRILTRGQK